MKKKINSPSHKIVKAEGGLLLCMHGSPVLSAACGSAQRGLGVRGVARTAFSYGTCPPWKLRSWPWIKVLWMNVLRSHPLMIWPSLHSYPQNFFCFLLFLSLLFFHLPLGLLQQLSNRSAPVVYSGASYLPKVQNETHRLCLKTYFCSCRPLGQVQAS